MLALTIDSNDVRLSVTVRGFRVKHSQIYRVSALFILAVHNWSSYPAYFLAAYLLPNFKLLARYTLNLSMKEVVRTD